MIKRMVLAIALTLSLMSCDECEPTRETTTIVEQNIDYTSNGDVVWVVKYIIEDNCGNITERTDITKV